jgi:predicted ATPase
MISRIEAFKYRCFDHLDIQMGSYHVLAGPNGSGKTTLLDIPVLLGDMLRRGVAPAFLETPLMGGSARSQSLQELIFHKLGTYFAFAIELQLPESICIELLGRAPLSVQLDERRHPRGLRYEVRFQVFNYVELHVTDEFLSITPRESTEPESGWGIGGTRPQSWRAVIQRELGEPATLVPEYQGRKKYNLKLEAQELALANVPRDAEQFPATVWLRDFLERDILFYQPAWSKLRQACPPGQPLTLRADAVNLPWLVMNLKQQNPDSFEFWVDHVKVALPNLEAIAAVEREEDHHAYLKLDYCSGYSVTSSGLSDGTLHILALTIIPYLSNPPGLISLEEPENGIYPRAIELVLQSLSSVENTQVWLSTHSPIVLANTDLDALVVMRSAKDGRVEAISGTEHPRLKDWQAAIDLGSLFAAGVLS